MRKQFIGLMIAVGFLFFSNCFYILDQRQQALLFQFGEIVDTINEPGLHFKFPVVQTVAFLDNRILQATVEEKEVIAKDQKRLIVSAFAKYKIVDPLKFYQSVRDEVGVRSRLNSVLDSSLRLIIGEVPLATLLTNERADVMKKIQQLVNTQATNFGVNMIDVRILRADLPKENSEAIFRRMQTDREKEAKEFRAEGAEEAERVRSKADRERKVLIAEAQKNADILRGEGDAISSKIYSDAYSLDPEFFDFYRAMLAYKNALQPDNTSIVLSPKSDFFKYFQNFR